MSPTPQELHRSNYSPALARALARTLGEAPIVTAWPGEFARAFLDEAHVAGASAYIVSLDGLVDSVHLGRAQLQELGVASATWPYEVASRLEEIALPVVTRQVPLTGDTATAIRIAALCLAAEADEHGPSPVGNRYREIAAGITLLERRANGLAPVTETIILATE